MKKKMSGEKFSKKVRNYLTMMGGMIMLLSLFSCGNAKKAEPSEVKDMIQQKLNEKYGTEFTVEKVEEIKGNSAFMESFYSAEAYSVDEGKGVFGVSIDRKCETMKDDYPRILFGDRITEYVEGLLQEANMVEEYKFSIVYRKSEETWKDEEDMEDYLLHSDTYIDGKITVKAKSGKEAAENAYHVADKLKAAHLQFIIEFTGGGKRRCISNTNDLNMPSFDEIVADFNEE